MKKIQKLYELPATDQEIIDIVEKNSFANVAKADDGDDEFHGVLLVPARVGGCFAIGGVRVAWLCLSKIV